MLISGLFANTSSFCSLLFSYSKILKRELICIDGGAGLGETSELIVKNSAYGCKVFSYEPNPENVNNFSYFNKSIQIIDAALGSSECTAKFSVHKNTDSSKFDNLYKKAGTSFVGRLATDTSILENTYDVRVVSLENEMRRLNVEYIDFMKLDLQGGELEALRGLGKFKQHVKLMWVEYSGQNNLLDWFPQNNFYFFDTEYLFVGEPNNLIHELFTINRQGRNSINKQIFFGSRKHRWRNYEQVFDFMKRRRRMVQTDLIVINKEYLHLLLESYAASNTNETSFYAEEPEILRSIK